MRLRVNKEPTARPRSVQTVNPISDRGQHKIQPSVEIMELFYILVALSGINISLFFERSTGDDYTLSELIGRSRLCNNGADMVVFV